MSNKTLGLGFGPLSGSIAEQLTAQNFSYDKKKVAEFENIKECLITIRFADLLPDSAYDKAVQKLFKKIEAHVLKKNNLTKVKP